MHRLIPNELILKLSYWPKHKYKNDEFDLTFSSKSPTECYKLKILGIFCIILFVSSTVINSLILYVFWKYKSLRTPLNVLVIALAILNLTGTITQLPFIIISNLSCRWTFDKWGCITSSVIMFWIGCTSIYLMTAISFQRFYILYKPFSIRNISYKTSFIIVFACIFYGLLWSLFPVFGWSYYTLEGSLTSCGVEWRKKSFNLNSFKVAIFVFVYFIPLVSIVSFSIWLIIKVKETSTKLNKSQSKKRLVKEKKLSLVIIASIIAFILSWTPYALISMYLAFVDPNAQVPPLLITSCSILGKTCLLWSSLIYVFFNSEIHQKIVKIKIIDFKLKNFKRAPSCKNKIFEQKPNSQIESEKILQNQTFV